MGVNQNSLDRLICPIGCLEIPGKHPASIAVSIVAQLLSYPVDQPQETMMPLTAGNVR